MSDNKRETKKIAVNIAGVSYQLVSSKDETHVREIASIADGAINNIMRASPSLSYSQATVLALVNFVENAKNYNDSFEKEKKISLDAVENQKKSKQELDFQRDENFELKKEIFRVNELNRNLELEIAKLRQTEIDTIPKIEEKLEEDKLVDEFLEDVSNPFDDEKEEQTDTTTNDENDFHPLKQQSFDEVET